MRANRSDTDEFKVSNIWGSKTVTGSLMSASKRLMKLWTQKHHCNLTQRTMPSWKMWFTTDSLFSLTPECQGTKSITEHARAQSHSTAFPEARHQHYWSSVGPKGRADILMSLKPGELFQNSAERKLQESTTAASHPGRRRPTDLRKERKWTSLNFSSKNKSVPFGGGCWRWVWRKVWVITIAEY